MKTCANLVKGLLRRFRPRIIYTHSACAIELACDEHALESAICEDASSRNWRKSFKNVFFFLLTVGDDTIQTFEHSLITFKSKNKLTYNNQKKMYCS